MDVDVVTLKDGTRVLSAVVGAVRANLTALQDGRYGMDGVLAVYEVGKLARDPKHEVFSPAQFELLRNFGLVRGTYEAPEMQAAVRDVVRCMVEFRGETPVLVDPLLAGGAA